MVKKSDYTYEQIKGMPDDQKTKVLKELKVRFPENKELAEYLDVLPIVASNLVGKYVEGRQMGRQKMTPEEKAQAKAARELKKQQEAEVEKIKEEEKEAEVLKGSFSIKFGKEATGEDAIIMLSGISSSLLKESKYKISLVIEEV